MIALLLNHLWQSTLCLAGAGLLALALHRNGANVRFWLWFAASVKFLVPFAVLTALGTYYLTPIVPPQPAVALIEPLIVPLAQPSPTMALTIPAAGSPAPAIILTTADPGPAVPDLESVLLAVWLAGFLIVILRWLVRWSRLRTLLRDAQTVPVDVPLEVKFSASLLEPGLAGILKPVILLPQGIEQQLSAVELKAVLAHELCHWRRHDNLLAAVHMLVEALFWFFPPVWWIGARLNAERERACDEGVLAQGNDPQEYAEGILKVCRAYLQSPLACVAGVSGGGLKARIDAIMENRLIPRLNAARKLVLSVSAALVLAVPLALGLATVPVAQIQAKAAQILTPIAQITAPAPSNEPAPSQNIASALPVETPSQPENLTPPSPDLPALPNETLATPVLVASNDARAASDLPTAPAQPAAPAPVQVSSDKPPAVWNCRNPNIYGRVISLAAIQLQGFNCFLGTFGADKSTVGPSGSPDNLRLGDCPNASSYPNAANRWCKYDVTMSVQLADPADADKMQPGKLLRLSGDFRVMRKDSVDYLSVANAKVIWTDPFDRTTSGDQPAAFAQPATQAVAPRPKTEAGIRCLLGLAPDGCETVFANPDVARRSIDNLVNVPLEGGDTGNPWGVLESIEYLGTNADGNDVYSVKFMHRKLTYLLPQPGPDGKIVTRCRFDGPPAGAMYGQCLGNGSGPLPVIARTSAMKVTSHAPRILYTRSHSGAPTQVATASTETDAVTGKALDPIRTIKPHAETARAMLCLLGADPKAPCRDDFWGPARHGAIESMRWTIGQRNFNLGELVSAEYVYTQSQNAYTTSALNGRTADVYYVKFGNQDLTFYIARPESDGKIHIWFARNGAPDDEKTEPLGLSRIR